MLSSIYLVLLFNFIFIFIFFKKNYLIADKLKLYDKPDFKRKIHLNKTPLTGGIYFLITIILYQIFFNEVSNIRVIYYTIFFIIFFLIGLIDDLINLNPSSKIIAIFFVALLFISLDQNSRLFEIKVLINDDIQLFFKNFNTIFLSAIFLTSFIIVFNLIDGANGVALSLFTIWVIFINLNNNLDIVTIFFFFLNVFFYFVFNINNKSFLGSSGNIILSLILYINIVREYNSNDSFDILYVIVFLFLPYIDAARLFMLRIIKKKSPFTADKNHFHHYLVRNRFFRKIYLLVIFIIVSLPLFFLYIFQINILLIITLNIISYFVFIFYLIKFNNKIR